MSNSAERAAVGKGDDTGVKRGAGGASRSRNVCRSDGLGTGPVKRHREVPSIVHPSVHADTPINRPTYVTVGAASWRANVLRLSPEVVWIC